MWLWVATISMHIWELGITRMGTLHNHSRRRCEKRLSFNPLMLRYSTSYYNLGHVCIAWPLSRECFKLDRESWGVANSIVDDYLGVANKESDIWPSVLDQV